MHVLSNDQESSELGLLDLLKQEKKGKKTRFLRKFPQKCRFLIENLKRNVTTEDSDYIQKLYRS